MRSRTAPPPQFNIIFLLFFFFFCYLCSETVCVKKSTRPYYQLSSDEGVRVTETWSVLQQGAKINSSQQNKKNI